MEAIVVDKVYKWFGRELVLNGVSLSVSRGEAIGIVGPNGCGKTTLLRIITGVLKPDSGRVIVRGSIGYVPQDNVLLPWLTIEGNIELGLKIRGLSRSVRREKVRGASKLLGISEYLSMYPLRVSGGTARKASIARALVLDPDILLLDEPYTGLDAKSIESLQSSLKKLKGKVTMIIVSHQIRELAEVVDRIVVFSHKPTVVEREFRVDSMKHRIL